MSEELKMNVERLTLDLRNALTLWSGQNKITEAVQASVKNDQAHVLFRVLNNAAWEHPTHGILVRMLRFEASEGFMFKCCKRYMTQKTDQGVTLGFMWEMSVSAKNLPEAVDKMRRILGSCVHAVAGGAEPNYDEHGNFDAKPEDAPGVLSPDEAVSDEPRVSRFKGVDRALLTQPNGHRAAQNQRGVVPDGDGNTKRSFTVAMPGSQLSTGKGSIGVVTAPSVNKRHGGR